MAIEVCENCRFWDTKTKALGSGVGLCRRRAPPVMAPQDSDAVDSYELWPMWPKTLDDEWCGEFEMMRKAHDE